MTLPKTGQEEIPIAFEPALRDRNRTDMTCLSQIVCDHPELAELIEAWFLEYYWSLSEQEQESILKLLGQSEIISAKK